MVYANSCYRACMVLAHGRIAPSCDAWRVWRFYPHRGMQKRALHLLSVRRQEGVLMEVIDGATESEAQGQVIVWPWYVRWLAVAYVLSRITDSASFFVLAGVSAYLIARQGVGRGSVVAMVAAVACPLGGAAFRWWFRAWGQRRWPQTEPSSSPDRLGTR